MREEGSRERAPEDPGEGRGVSIEGLIMGRSEGTSSCKFLRVPESSCEFLRVPESSL